MTECQRLTAYLGERQRINAGFAADEILAVFSRRKVANSVLMRGIAGFGARHVLRTDQTLSLSEDPPVVIAAVDTPEVMGPLAGELAAMSPSGLVTLERARLLDESDSGLTTSGADSVAVSVALGRNRRINGVPVSHAVCDLLYRNHFDGAAAFLGVDGTSHGERRRARFFSRNLDVPMVILGVGTTAQLSAALPELHAVEHALISVEQVQVCKRDGLLLSDPEPLPDNHFQLQRLTVHTSEDTRHDGLPIHRALVRRLRQSGTAHGATVLRGIRGFHGNHPPHGDSLIQFGRRVPVTTLVIDTPANIRRSFAIVDELTAEHGLVTCQAVSRPPTLRPGSEGGSDHGLSSP